MKGVHCRQGGAAQRTQQRRTFARRIKQRCIRLWGHFAPNLNSACSPAWRGSPTVTHHPQVLFQAATCRPAGGARRPLLAAGLPQLQGVPLRRLKLSAALPFVFEGAEPKRDNRAVLNRTTQRMIQVAAGEMTRA